jgi:hypothetical protein
MWVLINCLNERTVHSVAGVLEEHCSQQTPLRGVAVQTGRIGNFRQKIYSSEDGIDETISLFRWNSGCLIEQKTLVISFPTILQGRKLLKILSMEQKYHSVKETTGNSITWYKNKGKHLEFCSEPFWLREKENNYEFCSVEQK